MSEYKYVISLTPTEKKGASIRFQTLRERERFLDLLNSGRTDSAIRLTEIKEIESVKKDVTSDER